MMSLTKKKMTQSTSDEIFEDWWRTQGVRTYSPRHGSADGHKDYMAHAFWAGYELGRKSETNTPKNDIRGA